MKEIHILENDKLTWKLHPVTKSEANDQVWWAGYEYIRGWLQK